jgi:hypothetical protein
MAKKLNFSYTFVPSANQVVVSGINISLNELLLITNVTKGKIIYNFSDTTAIANSISYDSVSNATTITLKYDCSLMSSSDILQIFTETSATQIEPVASLYDPVNKFRTSTPQALIDTDFEYGTQVSKWENVALVDNRPFAYSQSVPLSGIGTVTMSANSKKVSVASTLPLPGIGSAITVQDTFLQFANGNFIIEDANVAAGVVTYSAKAINTTGITNIFDPNKTGIYSGTTFTGAAIGGPPKFTGRSDTTGFAVTVTTTVPHGLSLGNSIAVVGVNSRTDQNLNGSYVIHRVLDQNRFTFYSPFPVPVAYTAGTGNPGAAYTASSSLFVRSNAYFLHRPYDGGVLFGSGASSNYEQAIRQTRRYFRYQSGKGIQMSSGTLMKPNFQVDKLAYDSGSGLVTVQTKEPHGVLYVVPGSQITVVGANESAYNGTFSIFSVTGYNTFTYQPLTTPSSTTASGTYTVAVTKWYGCVNRLGIFDGQNGLFFEFDGQTLYAVRRNSTYQIGGKVSVTAGQNTVTQTNAAFPTSFGRQLVVGDYVVIRGVSYRVIDIDSDTSMVISPSYRGASSDYVTISKTIDTRMPQASWNLDKCDGTGPSGYNLDLSKMQMFYIDYSWYGAGFIRWGFRGPDGNVFYVHKLVNNNVNSEAYMRSGNLPARYESTTKPPSTITTQQINPGDTFIGIASTGGFPPAGTVSIGNTTFEFVNYTGVGTTCLTGVIREKAGEPAGIAASTTTSDNLVAVAATTNLQVGQRAFSHALPENAFITSIGVGNVRLSQGALASISGIGMTFTPMGLSGAPQTFSYSATGPTIVELAYPTFAPAISHWGTSAIMDGRFDDDKSLVFTYGQTVGLPVTGGATRALFSIRVAPSVDNGIAANFGQRDLVNRMQLVLRTLDITVNGGSSANANLLVKAILNGVPSSATPWTNAVGNVANIANSSLAQIADYGANPGAGTSVSVFGGETTAGFFVGAGSNSVELDKVRDLGNCVIGGGTTFANSGIYPDGPDTLTIIVTNVGAGIATCLGRIAWTEAQA